LVNSWGITIIGDNLWVADNGTQLITVYDFEGSPTGLVIPVEKPTLPPVFFSPTGIVYNPSNNFVITTVPIHLPAFVLTATEQGTIHGYNAATGGFAIPVVDHSGSFTEYKGLAITNENIFAANFRNDLMQGAIDVFDTNFASVFSFPFSDPTLPATYSPFNIKLIDEYFYVTYAVQNPDPSHAGDDLAGVSNGIINRFDLDGVFFDRFAEFGALNSPWGVTKAPEDLGFCHGSILVGNFGDGFLLNYSKDKKFLGKVKDCNGDFLQIPGLWGLVNGHEHRHHNRRHHHRHPSIFFASGPGDEGHGLVGSLSKC